jgi:hypothetical protein
MPNTQNDTIDCYTCGAEAGETCGKGCPSEATRGVHNDSLAKAVAHLGAVEVAPGRYAWKTERHWYSEGAYSLETYGKENLIPFDYAHKDFVRMPPWWTPQTQYAWRNYIGANRWVTTVERVESVPSAGENPWPVLSRERITADLATGEEVPC